ncbi:MAG: transposase [Planctomycetaceae bacterium]|nr:transposase [Planctomycetaceae bacterium]
MATKARFACPQNVPKNGYAESFNSRPLDGFLAFEEFENLTAAKTLTRMYRDNYNEHRLHSSLDYLTPAEFTRQYSASVACAPSTEHFRKNDEANVELNLPVLS